MKIGDIIYFEPCGNAARYDKSIIHTRVSKVGRKYFEVNELKWNRFLIETLVHDGGDYEPNYYGYHSLKEIEDKKEAVRLNSEIRECFSGYGQSRYSLNQLKSIIEIIKKD